MEVRWGIADIERRPESVLTVGTFDGIHLGHQYILNQLTSKAQDLGVTSTVVTFDPHPKLVVGSKDEPEIRLLTTIDEKIEVLQSVGLDRVIVINFTKEFSRQSSTEFVENLLYDKIGFQEFVIGYDHAFGKDREGTIATLSAMQARLGFGLTELSAFSTDDMIISSTRIRSLLREGDIRKANRALGRNYKISGEVVPGKGRGKKMAFPTANVRLDNPNKLIPADGVYAVWVTVDSHVHTGMMNIGRRPTFSSDVHTVEVHLIDFDKDIYGKPIRIEFVERIRNEQKFDNVEELIHQLKKDRKTVTNILQN